MTEERLETVETSKLKREQIAKTSQNFVHKQLSLANAAEIMRPFYEPGSEFVVFAENDIEDFYEYEDYT